MQKSLKDKNKNLETNQNQYKYEHKTINTKQTKER